MNIQWKSPWQDDLIWCPSQLERDYFHPYEKKQYTLYCRWRHIDPWMFATFIRQEKINDDWTIIGNGLTRETKIYIVHKYAEKLLQNYLANFKRGMIK